MAVLPIHSDLLRAASQPPHPQQGDGSTDRVRFRNVGALKPRRVFDDEQQGDTVRVATERAEEIVRSFRTLSVWWSDEQIAAFSALEEAIEAKGTPHAD